MADGYSNALPHCCRVGTDIAFSSSYVPAEAAAGLVLKTKSAALRDGDTILAIVKSTDTKSDGRSQGLVAPNVKAQIAMQISLLEKAGLAPSQIEYVLFFLFSFYLLTFSQLH